MRRTNWKTVSTLVTVMVLAGCMDNTVSAPSASTGVTSAMFAPAERPHLSLNDFGSLSGNTQADFVVPPSGGTFFVGGNAVVFPANSICDPNTSSYGPDTWDQPCAPAASSVKIHAVVRTGKLGTWVDFTPSLRFVPSANASKWVWLLMYNPAAAGQDLSKFQIKYAKALKDAGVDETTSDVSVRTYWDGALLLRRIKHFSGYTSSSGKACDPAVETDCYWVDDSGIGGGR